MRRRPPFVIGYDVVGQIDQLGGGVSGLQLGDRVADMTVIGANADYCTLQADRVIRVPLGVDAAEAAALILSWTTAYQLLHRAARVQRGQRVLVVGAARRQWIGLPARERIDKGWGRRLAEPRRKFRPQPQGTDRLGQTRTWNQAPVPELWREIL